MLGKNVNVTTKPTAMPRHIIQPKSTTGTIELAINEPKAAIVVTELYAQGANLLRIVARTRSRTEDVESR